MGDLTPTRHAEICAHLDALEDGGISFDTSELMLREVLDALITALARAEAAEKRVRELSERLEITHVYELKDGEMARKDLAETLDFDMDGISCRDETIKLLERRAESAERALREATEPRDMSTAPRDGTPIILHSGRESWAGFWHDGSENYWKKAGWYDLAETESILTARPIEADGWWPLPALEPKT